MKRIFTLALMCACLTMGCGVRPNVTPPTAAQAAAIGIDDFAALAQAAQDSEIALYHQSTIDAPTHLDIQKAFKRTGANIQAVSRAITDGRSAATVSVLISTLTNEINTDLTNSVLGVKNPDTQAKLKSLITALGKTAATLTGGK